MNISKSKIKTLENCPLLFKWQYLDHKIPDIPPAAVTKTGTDVHDIFNKFYDNIKLEQISELPLEYFKNSMKVLPQYQGIFDLFCKFQARRWELTKDKSEFMPILKEKKFINNDEVGVVDAVHYTAGQYLVLDYKSSANNPTNLRFELNYYAKIVNDSNILDKPVKFIGVYGYKDGSIFYEDIKVRSYNIMLKKVDEFRKTDWEKLDYIKKIGFHCSWCPYITSCNKISPNPPIVEQTSEE